MPNCSMIMCLQSGKPVEKRVAFQGAERAEAACNQGMSILFMQ